VQQNRNLIGQSLQFFFEPEPSAIAEDKLSKRWGMELLMRNIERTGGRLDRGLQRITNPVSDKYQFKAC
jgi:hypothetical protein